MPLLVKRKQEAMRKFSQAIVNFVRRDDGPTAVEYAVIIAFVLVVCLAAIAVVGTATGGVFISTSSSVGGP